MKIFFSISIITIILRTTLWSQNWIGLSSIDPDEPVINLTHSDNQKVTFTVELKGFYSTTITETGVIYQRLSIPGCGVTNITGEPEMPVISKRIAIPECSGIKYTVQITASQTLSGYRVYPVPEMQQNSNGILEEVFNINPLAICKTLLLLPKTML